MPSTEIQQQTRTELSEFLKNFRAQLVVKKDEQFSDTINRLPSASALGECACSTHHVFDRLQKNNTRREEIETDIVGRVKNRFPISSYPILNYLSLGSGYLLQDYILCVKLLLEGYSLNIASVEPRNTPQHQTARDEFIRKLTEIADKLGLTVNIRYYPLIDNFILDSQETIHVAHAIDYQFARGCLDELLKLHYVLDQNSVMYVASAIYDWIFSKQELLEEKKSTIPGMNYVFPEQLNQQVSLLARNTLILSKQKEVEEKTIAAEKALTDKKDLRRYLLANQFFHVPIDEKFEAHMENFIKLYAP